MLPSNPIKQMFTENDGVSWDLGRIMAVIAFVVMVVKFCQETGFSGGQSFALGAGALIASVAANKFSEGK